MRHRGKGAGGLRRGRARTVVSDSTIGPLLAASLHQAIGELLPARLEFYEHWLRPARLQAPMGLAPIVAVLSFLRREGDHGGLYAPIVARAGRYAADWSYDQLPAPVRGVIGRVPRFARVMAALAIARRLVRRTSTTSRANGRARRGAGRMEIWASVFCDVRAASATPLCGYYVSALQRLFERTGLVATVVADRCRASGNPECVITFAAASAEAQP